MHPWPLVEGKAEANSARPIFEVSLLAFFPFLRMQVVRSQSDLFHKKGERGVIHLVIAMQ